LVAAAIIILAVILITFNQATARSRSTISLPAHEVVEPSLAEGA
jgi:hypothetical protein